jgi:hypothetical protein
VQLWAGSPGITPVIMGYLVQQGLYRWATTWPRKHAEEERARERAYEQQRYANPSPGSPSYGNGAQGSFLIRRWRAVDSNPRSPVEKKPIYVSQKELCSAWQRAPETATSGQV